jgi:hypothetical protein
VHALNDEVTMRERYQRTFWGMQATICAVSIGIFLWAHVWQVATLFFVTMQIGAVIGAAWAVRIKAKLERHSAKLALAQTPHASR